MGDFENGKGNKENVMTLMDYLLIGLVVSTMSFLFLIPNQKQESKLIVMAFWVFVFIWPIVIALLIHVIILLVWNTLRGAVKWTKR